MLPLLPLWCPLCGREGGKCSECDSFNRMRQLAAVILPEASRIYGRPLQVGCAEVAAAWVHGCMLTAG